MSFDIEQKLKLDFLGDNWKDCYLTFNSLTIGEVDTLKNIDPNDPNNFSKAIDLVVKKFVSGKGISGGEMVVINKNDIKDLPVSVLNSALKLLAPADGFDEKKIPN